MADPSVETIDLEKLRQATGEEPVIAVSKRIILRAVKEGATDIHIEPLSDRTAVSLRIGGRLREVMAVPKHIHQSLVDRYKRVAEIFAADRETPQQGRMSLIVMRKPYEFLVTTRPAALGEEIDITVSAAEPTP
jgi:type II secretory ATPase GspE/PulE/Tfp pilus assembly ATPase PilB-like protein